ncbi:MAG: hemerythrin family protein [Defluviitaleaceae bacterium]|nr:hemerythrin family protein [Defluviitaleaceae bacterium]
MVWSEKYETGNKQVDDEHKQLFSLVQKVIDQSFNTRIEKIETAINFLAEYTVAHFKHEEELMDESGYPGTVVHKKQHSDFLTEVVKMKDKILREGDCLDNSLLINKTVSKWLTGHVIGSDLAMAAHYRQWSVEHKK